jgi:hypothetical protein
MAPLGRQLNCIPAGVDCPGLRQGLGWPGSCFHGGHAHPLLLAMLLPMHPEMPWSSVSLHRIQLGTCCEASAVALAGARQLQGPVSQA